MLKKEDIERFATIEENKMEDPYTLLALFACLIIRTFQLVFFQPEQCFSLTTNQPEQCFVLFFFSSEANGAKKCVTALEELPDLQMEEMIKAADMDGWCVYSPKVCSNG